MTKIVSKLNELVSFWNKTKKLETNSVILQACSNDTYLQN